MLTFYSHYIPFIYPLQYIAIIYPINSIFRFAPGEDCDHWAFRAYATPNVTAVDRLSGNAGRRLATREVFSHGSEIWINSNELYGNILENIL